MTDVLTAKQRQLNMSRIRSRDTKPEMLIRRGLHAKGLRYRLHDKTLPGRPDLVFPRYRTVVFIHGCFWHFHKCALSKLPETRKDFWRQKLELNEVRDKKTVTELLDTGWRVLAIWECALRGKHRMTDIDVLAHAAKFIRNTQPTTLTISSLNEPYT
ncbi:very short patch repair endonuclease [Pseudomonas sp. NKUCC02_KPG]|uniref:very short patch repair endonuclease n=1 Tax=Pseudomonas sp. NKUCC02_KPG TaxID=2842124 RepID=UPI001C5B12D4|nr:very short patch repair endonuclease [Pseudomonas sp. NKUCC02_KPG]MBW3503319.1 very short patch repair endonuclease [Pseudomonas sp. NKUCC02_KPG]